MRRLEDEITMKTPGVSTVAGLERVRLAALKCSDGDLAKLDAAIALANRDFRDLLMAAGFSDPTAHLDWRPGGED